MSDPPVWVLSSPQYSFRASDSCGMHESDDAIQHCTSIRFYLGFPFSRLSNSSNGSWCQGDGGIEGGIYPPIARPVPCFFSRRIFCHPHTL